MLHPQDNTDDTVELDDKPEIKEEIQTEEISVEENIADAEPVNIEQEELQPLNLDIADEDIEVPSPHVTTGKFVSKPKNWGVRIPPHRL
jgi:hypothetical protein